MPRQTYIAKPGEIKTVWRHVDAEGKTLGRLATEVATVLMGKHRPDYTPNVDCGEAVVVTNAAQVALDRHAAVRRIVPADAAVVPRGDDARTVGRNRRGARPRRGLRGPPPR